MQKLSHFFLLFYVVGLTTIKYSKPSLNYQHWDNSKTGALVKLADEINFCEIVLRTTHDSC